MSIASPCSARPFDIRCGTIRGTSYLPSLSFVKKKSASQKLDPIGAIKGIPELLATLLPPLLLFVLMEFIIYHLLFFIPAEWSWEAVGDDRTPSLGTLYVEWDTRTLLTLLFSIPATYIAYFRIQKLHRKLRQRP